MRNLDESVGEATRLALLVGELKEAFKATDGQVRAPLTGSSSIKLNLGGRTVQHQNTAGAWNHLARVKANRAACLLRNMMFSKAYKNDLFPSSTFLNSVEQSNYEDVSLNMPGRTCQVTALSFATERASPEARVVCGLLLRLVRAMVLGH